MFFDFITPVAIIIYASNIQQKTALLKVRSYPPKDEINY